MLNAGVVKEWEWAVGVVTTVPQTSCAGIGDGRARVSAQVCSSVVRAAAWTRRRYCVGEGVGGGVSVRRVMLVAAADEGDCCWIWRARIFIFRFFFSFELS